MGTQGAFLLVQTMLFLAPIVGVIWKVTSMVHDVKENKKDLNNLGEKVREMQADIKKEQTSLSDKISVMGNNIVELLTSLQHMKQSIEDVKRDVKEINAAHGKDT